MLIIITRPVMCDEHRCQLKTLEKQDAIILMKEATYLADTLSDFAVPCFIYQPDALLRGIDCDNAKLIDDAGLVALSHSHTPWITW